MYECASYGSWTTVRFYDGHVALGVHGVPSRSWDLEYNCNTPRLRAERGRVWVTIVSASQLQAVSEIGVVLVAFSV